MMNEASLATHGKARGTHGKRLTIAVMRVSEVQISRIADRV